MDLNTKEGYDSFVKVAFLVIVIIFVIASITEPKKALEWSFRGPVQKVSYDGQHTPSVTVNHKEYYLYNVKWDREIEIHVGDIIIKEKGDLLIKLVRKNTKDTIYDRTIDDFLIK
jgi:hypothetical protein